MFKDLIRGLPILIGLVLTLGLDIVLAKSTHDHAVDENLVRQHRNDASHDTLDFFLRWRDLLIAVITGVFVLQFAAAEAVTSERHWAPRLGSSQPVFDISLTDLASFVTIVLIPLIILLTWLLADRLKPAHLRTNREYWLRRIFFVVPWYVMALFFLYA